MASSSFLLTAFFSTILFSLITLANSSSTFLHFKSIVSFGDSLTDTGNYLMSRKGDDDVGRFPYGETYFRRPTGRFSDGRIILDFIAEAMGLPYVAPFLEKSRVGDFRRGVNFAVGGATAIEPSFFRERGVNICTNYSLGVQVELFRKLLPSLCGGNYSDCNDFLSKTIFFVGEIGGNDYHTPLLQGTKLEDVVSYVPRVINAISSAIDELVELGAKTLVVPGYLPVGCISGILAKFQSLKEEDYDPKTKCIKWINEFAEYHNEQLKYELERSRQRHPSAMIIYADYYDATARIFRHPRHFGFGEDYLSACCGGGGPYNYNESAACGTERATICSDPSKYIIWDGLHFTEAAYRAIAHGLIRGPCAFLPSQSNISYNIFDLA